MDAIVNLILDNSVWILTIIIVILLAIVGYLADKTGFGQKRAKLIKIPKAKHEIPIMQSMPTPSPTSVVVEPPIVVPKEEPITVDTLTVDNLDEGFDQLLPEKTVFDDSLLSSIDSLTFDEQKKTSKRMPKMEEIELPKIESLSDDIDELWRF